MQNSDIKRNEWSIAIDQIIDNKFNTIKDKVVQSMLLLEKKNNAKISHKITNVPDLRFYTKLGKGKNIASPLGKHFFILRKNAEMHLYLSNPYLTLKKYPFLHDKGKPKNHYQIKPVDAKNISKGQLHELIFISFGFIANIPISDLLNLQQSENFI